MKIHPSEVLRGRLDAEFHGEFDFEGLEAWEGQEKVVFEGQRADMVKMHSEPISRFGQYRLWSKSIPRGSQGVKS